MYAIQGSLCARRRNVTSITKREKSPHRVARYGSPAAAEALGVAMGPFCAIRVPPAPPEELSQSPLGLSAVADPQSPMSRFTADVLYSQPAALSTSTRYSDVSFQSLVLLLLLLA